jgi:L-cystine transport system substrate-binding protein
MFISSVRKMWIAAFTCAVAAVLVLLGCSKSGGQGTLQQIQSRGVLRVGLEGTYPPFNFQDQSGQLVGFEVDFARALAAKMGVKAEFQPTPFAGLLGALEAGRIDVVINQITITPERQLKYGFSKPYTVSGIQIIVRKDDPRPIATPADLAGKTVGVGLGTNYEQWLRANAPQAVVKTYDDDPTKYQDLRAGRTDAVLNDRLVAVELLKSGAPFKAAGAPFAKQEMGVALRKDAELQAALDKAIDALRESGELSKISTQWFGEDVTK